MTCVLKADRNPPPKPDKSAKWVGLGISIPSNLHCVNCGAFPRIATALVPTSPATPANAELNRAGSSKPLANRDASSILIIRPPVMAIGLTVRSFFISGLTSTSAKSCTFSSIGISTNTSLDEVTDTSLMILGRYPIKDA